ncbi:hypothetical protein NA56DRAFT_662908 [Hyaloscypha hepaticicola]|uniref:Uncharacterized protein n=1 Tax=Hyaloscypha hepaticicola TaxID=2082293 RepID=A0A2J6PRR0_9HELO|nr:hypothetical protein NA56DRAFT_662908 [Hyaloscypha hepaticicola]
MSNIKWNNLNPFGSRRDKHKVRESDDVEVKTVGGKKISRPISMCPQCNVLYFSSICTSCGYRKGTSDQASDDSDVSPKTTTKAQQAQDRSEDKRAHTPVAPSTVYPSNSVSNYASNRTSDYPPNSGIYIRGQSEFYAHGYGRRRPSDTRESEVAESSTPTPAPRGQAGRGYPSTGTATISLGLCGYPGDYSPRGSPRPTPPPTPPTPPKPLSPSRPLRFVEEHELQNMKDIDLEADGEQRTWAGSSKSPSSCCKKFRGNMRHDGLWLMIIGGVVLATIITLGVLAVLQSKKSRQGGD